MAVTYRARRRIKLSPTEWREPGELVPEAHTWFRPESLEHTGFLQAVEVDDDELEQALGEYLDADTAAKVREVVANQPAKRGAWGPRPAYQPFRPEATAEQKPRVRARRTKVEEKSNG